MQLHKLKKNESRTYDVPPVYLTPAGIARLEKQLAELKRKLPTLAAEAARTAAYGDRSDNAEYKQAKGSLRGMHRKIFEIETQLRNAVAISSGPSATGTIQLGSKVILEIAKKSEIATRKTFEIVGPTETDPARGRISHESPLGAALIGRKKNEVIKIKIANGAEQEYKILEIK